MEIESIEWLVKKAEERKTKISTIVIELQAESDKTTTEETIKKMSSYFDIMKKSVEEGLNADFDFKTGLQNDIVKRAAAYYKSGKGISGELMGDVIVNAMAVSGQNASMGKIIAAPTAGSCGIMPAVLTVLEKKGCKKEDIVLSMFTAAGLADLIAQNATFSGAGGGCQAECGSASAMASCAMVEAMGGTPKQAADAFALSLSGVLGMVCDSVAGFVEIPCMTKNVLGAVNAVVSAELALSGIYSVIPADEVIFAMKEVGDNMDERFRETSLGGIAGTPTAKKISERLLGKK